MKNLYRLVEEYQLGADQFLEFVDKVFHHLPANVYISDLQKQQVIWCNRTNEESLGYSLDEIKAMGMGYFDKIIHPADREIPISSIRHFLNGQELFGGLFRAKGKKDEEYRWYLGWAVVLERDENEDARLILGVDLDMSATVDTSFQLKEAFRQMVRSSYSEDLEVLSKREREVLFYMSQGLCTEKVADKMSISMETVKSHRRSIKKKLGLHTSIELVAFAKDHGLG
jgi:DNA-binding CsgD family transcriptional regulator